MKLFALLFLTPLFMVYPQTINEHLNAYINTLEKPATAQQFQPLYHTSPVNQDTTSSCWSFATLSFLESEMDRLGKEPVKLAMMYPVYYGFIEKIKLFVETRGASRFSPGDLFTGAFDVIKKYGIVPLESYKGDTRACATFNHDALYEELDALTQNLKKQNNWNEEDAAADAITILNKHLGAPPSIFKYRGKDYTPESFRDEVVALPWDDYLMITSFTYSPFYDKIKLKVPDNWTENSNYLNLPLDEFTAALISALGKGFTAAVDADISEPAYRLNKEYLVIPPFDISGNEIDQTAREFRFNNGSTTDDHLMHIVAHKRFDNRDWFLVKDSWRTAFETDSPKGYMFMDVNYVKLKVLAYMIHKDALDLTKTGAN